MSSADHSQAEAHQLPITVHGHYLVLPPGGSGPYRLLIGFHGYGETAADHLAELARIDDLDGWVMAAVQGPSVFYRSRTGEVVASWMTRFNRQLAIADNRRYAAAVVAELGQRYPLTGRPVCAGFSQGVAMAYRAAAEVGAEAVLAIAGDVPPELATAGELPRCGRVLIARGEDDGWYDEAKERQDLALLGRHKVTAETFTYAGGHEWTPALYRRLGAFLRGL